MKRNGARTYGGGEDQGVGPFELELLCKRSGLPCQDIVGLNGHIWRGAEPLSGLSAALAAKPAIQVPTPNLRRGQHLSHGASL